MKLITRDTDYAVRALLYIAASSNQLVTTTELVENLNMPRPFTRKILQILQKRGFLRSVKGNRGGFSLARSPGKIYLQDLMRTFQGEITMVECVFRKKICRNRKTCPLRRELKNIEEYVIKKIDAITIKSLLRQPRTNIIGGHHGHVLSSM